jgi:glycosyltransferase involved in cell wall biosynthesis
MRIALISYEYPPETGFGGIGTYTYYQAHALARLGHKVHVFAGTQSAQRRTYRDGNVTVTRWRSVGFVERLVPRADLLGLHWFKNRLQNASNSLSALRRELQHGRFDVVEMPECGAEGALLNHVFDLPTVVRLHSPAELIMPTYPTRASDRVLTAIVERLGLTGARAITSCSHWLAKEVRSRLRIDRPISVIPNGIDLALFDQDDGIDAVERFGLPRDRVRIFFANRLEERKGIHVVRDLLLPVLQRHPEAMFVLAGADPNGIVARELQPMLAAHGLQHGLVHVGKLTLPEVRACLKQTDVFLLPSIWENAPYSLLEAMAAGKAIVASDCGGVPEILRHDVDGLVARTGDAASFARALHRLLADGALRLRFGQSARARVEARFTDEHVARRSLETYEWALGAPAARRSAGGVQPSIQLGPDNWFQAWWMRGGSPSERPELDPAFEQVGLAELDFAQALLKRLYWSGRGRSDVAEADYLDDLATLHRRRAVAAQAAGAEPEPSRRLALPALSHPIFGDEASTGAFLAELWRLGDRPMVAEWLLREIGAADFVDRASRRVAFRRLALEALRRRPGEQPLAVLRRIYRSVATAARVVQQDLDFFAADPHGPELAALVREHGLHAPLQRPAVFAVPRRRKAPSKAPKADVTVLIPSFKHEAYVVHAIESVLAQTHRGVQVLVVDDRSPDGTVAAARSVDDPRVVVRENERNLGLGGSIQAALASITTPFTALLNSDDVFHPERLERCLAVFAADPAAQLVATRLAVMDQKERRLTTDTSCVLDVGGAAHGWVRWYERITARLQGGDWTALPALLRHNHLATSSNVVCRTSFLAAQAAAFAPFKYCLDWQLFLRAANAGALRFVDEALLGYRLHGANTVWFDDVARPGYVHEVNAVVADALRGHVAARRAAGESGDAIAEEVAGLLRQHARAHGETGGETLFLAELLAGLDVVPAAYRSPQLAALAQEALAGKRGEALDADVAERLRLLRHAVDGLAEQNRRLEPEVGRLAAEVAGRSEQAEDVAALRDRLVETDERADAALDVAETVRHERDALAADLAEARARLDAAALAAGELKAQLERVADDRDRTVAARDENWRKAAALQSELTAAAAREAAMVQRAAESAAQAALQDRRLAETAASRDELAQRQLATGEALRRTLDELEMAQGKLSASRGELQAAQRGLQQTQRELDDAKHELQHTQSELQHTQSELQHTQSELQHTQSELQHTQHELQRTQHEVRLTVQQAEERRIAAAAAHAQAVAENAHWAIRALLDERQRRAQLAGSMEQRFGRLLLNKLALGGVVAVAQRGIEGGATALVRLAGGLRKAVPGRKPARTLLVVDGSYPDADAAPAATLAAALAEGGIEVRVACRESGSWHPLTKMLLPELDPRLAVPRDAWLQRRDRKWWQRRRPDIAAAVLAMPANAPAIARAFATARSARSASVCYLHGFGLGEAGIVAAGAGALTGMPFGLTLSRDDLPRLGAQPFRELVARAAALFVDSDELAAAVRRAAAAPLPALVVVPAFAVVAPSAVQRRPLPNRIACIGPFDDADGLLALAGALRRLVDAGVEPQLDVLGADIGIAANLVAVDWFKGRCAALGVADRVLFRPEASPVGIERALAEASVVVDVRSGGDRDPAGLGIGGVSALAAGVPLVGFREGAAGAVHDGDEALLAPRGDEAALATALQRLLGDAALGAAIGAAGRRRFDRSHAASVAAAEACARVRALRNAARG